MRLDRVYIDGFKNLKEVEADFDESRLTNVIIGQNGAGKSNLIEAIIDVFRFADMNRGAPRYTYEVEYRIGNHQVRLSNRKGVPSIEVDGKSMTRSAFDREKAEVFPDLVFGYYSGGSRRLEKLFDGHQRRYYDAIKINDDLDDCRRALAERRLFYCRPIHMRCHITTHMEVDMIVSPHDVTAPKAHWLLIDVLFSNDEWSLAIVGREAAYCLPLEREQKSSKRKPLFPRLPHVVYAAQ